MKTNVRSRLKSLCFVMAFLHSQACAPASRDASDARSFWTPEDPPRAAYVLDVNIDSEGEDVSVAAEGTITLTNTTSRPLSVLAFEWTVEPASGRLHADSDTYVSNRATPPHVWFMRGLLLFDGRAYSESLQAFWKCRGLSTASGDLFGALQHDQHGLRTNRAWVEERLKTPFTWSR